MNVQPHESRGSFAKPTGSRRRSGVSAVPSDYFSAFFASSFRGSSLTACSMALRVSARFP